MGKSGRVYDTEKAARGKAWKRGLIMTYRSGTEQATHAGPLT